ncbi:ATP-binding protein, partial [Nitrosomonas sp.]|uniref:ATP-binding protein n=1 Tax=Nitrosomonas sp. TaxID=42353 RepID=UPI001D407586
MTDSQKKAAVNALIPFVGLRPFDSADHRWFHGRDREIAALLRKVRNNRFTAVVGASGSGKSSLVRAGILASLAEDGWQTILAKPGSAPIAKLAAALSEAAHSSFSVE